MKQQQFENFTASSLYCEKCKVAKPVRERLLLVLTDREIFDYLKRNASSDSDRRNDKQQKGSVSSGITAANRANNGFPHARSHPQSKGLAMCQSCVDPLKYQKSLIAKGTPFQPLHHR